MKAWRWYDLGDMRLEDIPRPQAKPGWVVGKVKVVQASVTEAQAALGLATSSTERTRKMIRERAPVQLFGHELCAEIVELGEGVTGVRVRDRVAAGLALPCHECEMCRAGYTEMCPNRLHLGSQIPGAFAEYVALPAEILIVLPAAIDDNEGACMQPASSCLSAVNRARIEMGDTVAVLGQGIMGNYAMQVSRLAGAGKVITVDVKDDALALSAQLGADIAIDSRKMDPVKAVLELTGGIGADVVFEAAGGSPEAGLAGSKTLLQAFQMVRPGGRVVQIAFQNAPVTLNINSLRGKGIEYVMPQQPSARLVNHTVNLVAARRFQLAPLITHVLDGLDKVPQAFEMTANKGKFNIINPAQVVVSR